MGPDTRGAGPPGDTCVNRQQEDGRLHAEERDPRRNPPADILVLDSQPLELEKIQSVDLSTQSKALCYRSPRRGEFSPLPERHHVHRFLAGDLNQHCRERKTDGPPPSLDSPTKLKASLWDARLRRELLTLREKTARGGRRHLWVCSRDAQIGVLPFTPPNSRSSLQTQRQGSCPTTSRGIPGVPRRMGGMKGVHRTHRCSKTGTSCLGG